MLNLRPLLLAILAASSSAYADYSCQNVFSDRSKVDAAITPAKADEAAFLTLVLNPPYGAKPSNENPLIDYFAREKTTAEESVHRYSNKLNHFKQRLSFIEKFDLNLPIDVEFQRETLTAARASLILATSYSSSLRKLVNSFEQLPSRELTQVQLKSYRSILLSSDRLLTASTAVIEQNELANQIKAGSDAKLISLERTRVSAEAELQTELLSLKQAELAYDSKMLGLARDSQEKFDNKAHSELERRAFILKNFESRLEHETLDGRGLPSASLDLMERLALKTYTESAYLAINGDLWARNIPGLTELAPVIERLKSALNKLPGYNRATYRKVQLRETQLRDYKVGNEVVFLGFTSSSTTRESFDVDYNTTLVIHSTEGRLIRNFSIRMLEDEVLFAPNSRFSVISNSEPAKGHFVIELKQLN